MCPFLQILTVEKPCASLTFYLLQHTHILLHYSFEMCRYKPVFNGTALAKTEINSKISISLWWNVCLH